MKKLLMTLLAAALILCLTSAAFAEDFGFDFSGEGYEGEWTPIESLAVEFCLPEGWTQVAPTGDAAFSAVSADQTATLSVRQLAEGVEDLVAWGETNLDSYAVGDANFYEVLIVEQPQSVALRFLCDEDRLIAFDFTRADESALSLDFALQIAGSTYESWIDEGFPFDGDEDDFSFDDGEFPFDEEDADYDGEDLEFDFADLFESDMD